MDVINKTEIFEVKRCTFIGFGFSVLFFLLFLGVLILVLLG